jgi:hypothetical protein
MNKEKVFIVISHKNVLRKNSRGLSGGPKSPTQDSWETVETVEFVNALKNKHITMSKATADYLNRKVLSGQHLGMTDYETFEGYVRSKYPEQMAQLDAAYGRTQLAKEIENTVVDTDSPKLVSDEFGNIRPATVFDQVQ